jgi:hypothetical protein
MLDKEDSMCRFNDLEDEGELKRSTQTSSFTKPSKKWKFFSAEVVTHNPLNSNRKNMLQDGFPGGEGYNIANDQQ